MEQRKLRQVARLKTRQTKRIEFSKAAANKEEAAEKEALADDQADRLSSGYSTISST